MDSSSPICSCKRCIAALLYHTWRIKCIYSVWLFMWLVPNLAFQKYIKSLSGSVILFTTKVRWCYLHAKIDDTNSAITTFTSYQMTVQILKRAFGLFNALVKFSRTMHVRLDLFQWQSALLYLDRIIIFQEMVTRRYHTFAFYCTSYKSQKSCFIRMNGSIWRKRLNIVGL